MSLRHKRVTLSCICLPAILAILCGAQARIPAAGATFTEEDYPDGSKWPSASYEKTPGAALPIAAAARMDAAAVSFSAAELIQLQLPGRLKLRTGAASLVMLDGAPAKQDAAVASEGTEPIEEIDPEQLAAMAVAGPEL